MDQSKFDYFCNCFAESLVKMFSQTLGTEPTPDTQVKQSSEKKLSSIVGVVGLTKGRIHVEMTETLARKLYESANGEPAGDEMDLCFYLAEFTNMITGNGITKLNNTYKGSDLRLTPPAIFVDENLEITTPKEQSAARLFSTQFGQVRIEIGFEGV
ncbi:MAG: chemotaxis protein CheX [Bacillota bacterium]